MADPEIRTRFAWWPMRLWGKDYTATGTPFVNPVGWIWLRQVTEIYSLHATPPEWTAFEWRQP